MFLLCVKPLFCKNVIVTSVRPLSLFLEELLSDNDNIINVIPSNANPHFYEPTPSVVSKLKNADLFIGVEREFDGWIERFLPDKCVKMYLIKKDHVNPHIWLSPTIMLTKLNEVAANLCLSNLENCKTYKTNAQTLKEKLVLLTEKLRNKSLRYKNVKFIQLHPAWNYFGKDFNFNIVGTLTKHGVSFSPRKYSKLLDLVKFKNVKYVLAGLNSKDAILEGFTEKTGSKIIRLDPLSIKSRNYFQFIENNVNEIINQISKTGKN